MLTGGKILFKFLAVHVAKFSEEDRVNESIDCKVTLLGLDHSSNRMQVTTDD